MQTWPYRGVDADSRPGSNSIYLRPEGNLYKVTPSASAVVVMLLSSARLVELTPINPIRPKDVVTNLLRDTSDDSNRFDDSA